MEIDLTHSNPDDLAQSVCVSDLTDTVLQAERLSEREAEVLDYIYRQRLIALIRSAGPSEKSARDMQEFAEHLDRVTHPVRLSKLMALDSLYIDRWPAYLDLLQSCLAVMESDVPQRLLQRKNIKEILSIVLAHGSLGLKEIRETLNLKSANAARIVNMMESAQLIVTKKVGRENILSAGVNGMAFQSELVPESSKIKRGISYFRTSSVA